MEGVGDRKIRVWDGERMIYLCAGTELSGVNLQILMPSTSLLDRDGTEIYEWDVIEWIGNEYRGRISRRIVRRAVVAFGPNYDDSNFVIMGYSFKEATAESLVVGNIIESPKISVASRGPRIPSEEEIFSSRKVTHLESPVGTTLARPTMVRFYCCSHEHALEAYPPSYKEPCVRICLCGKAYIAGGHGNVFLLADLDLQLVEV